MRTTIETNKVFQKQKPHTEMMETGNTFQHKTPFKTTDTTPGLLQYALDQLSHRSLLQNACKLSV